MEVSASRIAIGILTLAVLALYFRHTLFADLPIFIAVQVLAAVLMLWARLTFGARSFHGEANPTEGNLMTKGPYQVIRHPIYSAILLFVWAGAASHLSLLNVAIAALASAAIIVRILAEERLLIERYPEYHRYAARTKRVIPFVF
jgi:protein-S-isoprenylcysteine O-methyltransferase Ste14